MTERSRTDDLGYLKRRDVAGGMSEIVDAFGEVVAVVATGAFPHDSKNGDVRRFRLKTTRDLSHA